MATGKGLQNLLGPITNNHVDLEMLVKFNPAMQQLRYGMEWLVGAPYDKFEDAGVATGKGLSPLLGAVANTTGITNLTSLVKFNPAMQQLRYGMEWLVGAPYDEFGDAGDATGKGLGSILTATSNTTGIANLASLVKFNPAMQQLRYGMEWLVGAPYDEFGDAGDATGKGLGSILTATSNTTGIANLASLVKFNPAMQQLRYGMEWLVGAPYEEFEDAGVATGKGLSPLLGAVASNHIDLEMLAKFNPAMQQLRYGMEWLVGAPYEEFEDAGVATGKGLSGLLPSINNSLQAINSLGALNAFPGGMQNLRYGMEWLVGAPYEKFGDAGVATGKGLSGLLPSINNSLQAINSLGALNAFPGGMQNLRYGMEWLVGAPYEKFGDAGIGAGKGLGHLLPSIGDNLQAINNLGALNAFPGGMQNLRYGMEWLVGAPYKKWSAIAQLVGEGLNSILDVMTRNAAGVALLPIMAGNIKEAFIGIAIGVMLFANLPSDKFIMQAAITAAGIGILLDGLAKNASGLALLPNFAANFLPAIFGIGVALAFADGVDSSTLKDFATNVVAGLDVLLGGIANNVAGIALLPNLASSLTLLSTLSSSLASISVDGFDAFVTSTSDGLSVLLAGISGNAEIVNRLPGLVEALRGLSDFAEHVTGGKGMIDIAVSVDSALSTMGDGLADYAAYVEASAVRISAALDIIQGKTSEFASNSVNQIVKNDAVITIHPDFDDAGANAERHREIVSKMDSLVGAIDKLNSTVEQRGDSESVKTIANMLNEYLPMLAEGADTGLAGKSSSWV